MDLKISIRKRLSNLSTDRLKSVRHDAWLWATGWDPRYDSDPRCDSALRSLVDECGFPFSGTWVFALEQEVTEELLNRAEAVLREAGQFLTAGGPCAISDALAVMALYPIED